MRLLREAGATEVHVRIASPPFKNPCFYGVDTSTYEELLCARMSVPEACEYIGADSLAYLSPDAFAYGVKVFGVTIHYVNGELDGGRIIAQRAFEYLGSDPEELEARVHAVEHPLYVETVAKLVAEQ